LEKRKLIFDVESAEMIDEDSASQFATAKMLLFSTGPNRHSMECDEETLRKTASTAFEKPIIFEFNAMYRDFGTHNEKTTIPAGFIVPNSQEFVKQEDGRWSFFALGKIWRRYSKNFLDIFKNNNKTSSKLSVEMDLLDSEKMPDGITKMKNFAYSAACILGDLVTEASPGANIEMLSFSKEKEDYEKAFKQEFSTRYDSLDFAVPSAVKANAQMGLDLYKEHGFGGNSVSLASARHLAKSEKSTPEKVRHVAKTLKGKKFDNVIKDPPNEIFVSYMLYGGNEGKVWSQDLSKELDALDEKKLSYFNFGEDESEKKEEKLVDEELEKKEETMAIETPEEKEEQKEESEEAKEEEEEKKEEMSLDANLDLAAVLQMLANETEDYKVLVQDFSDEGTKNYAKLCYAMYGKMMAMQEMCNKFAAEKEEMCGKFAEADEKNKAYMAENEDLKKFKADVEARQFMFEVDSTLKEIEMSVAIPKQEMEFLVEESKKFSLETVDAFKNLAKAKAFGFAVKGKKDDEVRRYALPFVLNDNSKKANSPW
jgi:hypothetical protein